MANKLKWEVQEAPTGSYRSFFRRGWPSATVEGRMAVTLRCADDYVPKNVRAGKHSEITICFADHREGVAFKWRALKRRAATLAEAKDIAQKFVDSNPTFFGLETPAATQVAAD